MNFKEVKEIEEKKLQLRERLNMLSDLTMREGVSLSTLVRDYHVAVVVAILMKDCDASGLVELCDDGFMIDEENFIEPLRLLNTKVKPEDFEAVRAVLDRRNFRAPRCEARWVQLSENGREGDSYHMRSRKGFLLEKGHQRVKSG